MSLKQRILRAFNLPIKIGSDSFGNKYYEKLNKDGKNLDIDIIFIYLIYIPYIPLYPLTLNPSSTLKLSMGRTEYRKVKAVPVIMTQK